MPRFHLNIYNGRECLDLEGIDLPHVEVAKLQAVEGARSFVAADVLDGRPICRSHRIEVVDESGTTVHIVRYVDVLTILP